MGKKILLVTAELAENLVRRYATESTLSSDVKVLPISVASFMTSELLINELKKIKLNDFSMLLVPGLVRFDLEKVEEELGLPVFKGPKYAADIPLVLGNLEKIELSKERPACELLNSEIKASVEKQLRMAEEAAKETLFEPYNFLIGKGGAAITAGRDSPPRVIAEIADAPILSDEKIIEVAKRYLESGAEIIDIGMIAEREMADEVPRLVSAIRDNFDAPISIDTFNRAEIKKAIECEIDLILSINGSTIDDFQNLDVPAVLVPTDPKRGHYPRAPVEKAWYLMELVEKSNKLGYERVIADPILEPVNQGFVKSLLSFYELRGLNPELPILMGIGNVIELYDADSVGMTALLVGAASELGASFVLTVEASDKTRGNVAEVRRAREMMTISKLRSTVPKDLGLDLLILKEKRKVFDLYDKKIEKLAKTIHASAKREFKLDPKGFFKIFVDKSEIVAVLYAGRDPKIVIRGRTAEEICAEIIERNLISEIEHATYIGRELQKAEIALRTGRGYLQEKGLF
jgi:dihydropteroate synthase-like protein